MKSRSISRALSTSRATSSVYVTGVHTKELGGKQLILDPATNQGTAFNLETRQMLGMHGLLPPQIFTQEQQLARCWHNYNKLTTDLERYRYLSDLSERNEKLFFLMLKSDIKKLMPIVYTPTVGDACLNFGGMFRRPKGMWITIHDKGHVKQILQNWPEKNVRAVVVTDGERILGLGDLGAYGMGIPVGKLALYTACGGIHPSACLPICLDVGTDNQKLLDDPFYIGLRQKRARGSEYDELVDEFMRAVRDVFGRLTLIQFEDFGNHNAFKFLKKYRNKYCMFNDDIQGTAACAVAGILAAEKITGTATKDEKFLFLGAGEAGMGIAGLIQQMLRDEGVPGHEIAKRITFFDADGLICEERIGNLEPDHVAYAHSIPHTKSFVEAVKTVRPTAIIGVAGAGPLFTQEVLETMAEINERPIVFSLSNPTSKTECSAADAYLHTGGRAIYASGSPQPAVTLESGPNAGQLIQPGQGNNVYIFPGVSLACILSGVRHIPARAFLVAAKAVAKECSPEEIARGQVYPDLDRIRETTIKVAAAVMDYVYSASSIESIASFLPEPRDKEQHIRDRLYSTDYPDLLPEMYSWPHEKVSHEHVQESTMPSTRRGKI